jgi:hypothetical protein
VGAANRFKAKRRFESRELMFGNLRPELLTAAHDLVDFSCGKSSLDRWLKTRALSNQEKGFTAVLVVHEANRIIGYYGLAPTAIVPSVLPRSIRSGQPPDPVPCLLLGQLATDRNWIGKGVGTGLLKHAGLGFALKSQH